jgi:tetratricopeptide (TPR) repeat protein
VLDKGLEQYPGDPRLLEMHGDVLCLLGFRRAAEMSYIEALERAPDRQSALLALGRVRVELGMENSALGPLRRRIELGGGDAATYELVGRAERALGHPREALDAYARVFERDPVDPEQVVAAAQVYSDDRTLRREPATQERVRGWLARAVAVDPQHTQAHYQLGLVQEDRGDGDEALESYRRAVETDPLCVAALTQLAELYESRGEHDQAVAMARRAILLEKDPGKRAALERLIEPPVASVSTQ